MSPQGKLQTATGAWTNAMRITVNLLRQLRPDLNEATLEHDAAALFARLAQHEPPILVCYPDELKD